MSDTCHKTLFDDLTQSKPIKRVLAGIRRRHAWCADDLAQQWLCDIWLAVSKGQIHGDMSLPQQVKYAMLLLRGAKQKTYTECASAVQPKPDYARAHPEVEPIGWAPHAPVESHEYAREELERLGQMDLDVDDIEELFLVGCKTPEDRDIVSLLLQGYGPGEIAEQLGCSERKVYSCLERIQSRMRDRD